jgi:hypothetical protein
MDETGENNDWALVRGARGWKDQTKCRPVTNTEKVKILVSGTKLTTRARTKALADPGQLIVKGDQSASGSQIACDTLSAAKSGRAQCLRKCARDPQTPAPNASNPCDS